RPEPVDSGVLPTLDRSRTNIELADLLDRRGLPKERQELRIFVDKGTEMSARTLGEPLENAHPIWVQAFLFLGKTRERHRVDDLFQMPLSDSIVAVTVGNDFALFGDANASGDRAAGLGENGAVRRSAAATHGSTATVKDL